MSPGSACFTKRRIILPDPAKAQAHATQGQAGRDIVAAILDGRTDDAVAMLRVDPKLAQTEIGYDPNRATERPQGQYGDLLTLAVSRCDLAQITRLLDAGLSPDGVQVGQPLTTALLADSPEMAELLLARGASPDPQKHGGAALFGEIASFGHVGAVMTLLRHGLDLGWQDQFGNGHLETAMDMEQFRIAALLIDKGANAWRVGGAGNMAVQALSKPLTIENADEDATRKRLAERLGRDALAKGLPWPPPDFATVRQKILAGAWPTPEMMKAGMPAPSAITMADMRKRFAAQTPSE